MPTFRSRPSGDLTSSVANLVRSGAGRLGPLDMMRADMAAAQTARNLSLAEKARLEAEEMRLADARRADPNAGVDYATNAAGMDYQQGPQLMRHLRGEMDPNPQGYEDASGNLYGDMRAPEPKLQPGQRGRFQSALAAHAAALLGNGKTNAQQMTGAAGNITEQALIDEASRAPDVETGNRLVAAVHGRLRQPYRTNTRGVTTNTETGAIDETSDLAGAVRRELGARTGRAEAQGRLADARSRVAGAPRLPTGQSPAQIEKWVSEIARKEWDLIPSAKRRGMNYEQHVASVRSRFQKSGDSPDQLISDAISAITRGADPEAVRRRFKERAGFDLPDSALMDAELESELDEELDD